MSELRAVGRQWMDRCNELAKGGAGRVSPNPLVGSVVLDSRGRLVGEGFHKKVGGPHAEVVALRAAGSKAKGGTLIVNLEPCNHHGRTPPCVDAIAEAGIERVAFGARDPIAGHAGGGRALRKAGLEVAAGIEAAVCEDANRIFFTSERDKRPHVVAKAAASLDGKSATASGESKWITGERARADGRVLRGERDAICVGVGTILADDPQLTPRRRGSRDPVRVVFDARLRTPLDAKVLPHNTTSKAACLIVASPSAQTLRERRLTDRGAEIIRVGRGKRPPVAAALERLYDRKIRSMLVEGGPTLLGSFLAADLVDEIRLYQAPIIVGGSAPSWLAGRSVAALADASRFELVSVERIAADLAITALRRR